MTDQETQDILKLYAEHEGAEWWPASRFEKSRLTGVHCLEHTPRDLILKCMLGSLLEWLAKYQVGVFRLASRDKWFLRTSTGGTVLHAALFPTAHYAALAAYKHIKEQA